ncbi:MAG: WxcM-like domain-containing protein [Bacteroidales bacterium]|nr:WxcM-like domain-containing protein [Bacteroidales bacterium]
MKNTVYNCSVIMLPKVHNRAGNLTALENQSNIPFEIKRVYYLYDVPGGEDRGGHAHRELQQFIVAVSGAFDVLIDDGINKKIVHLDRPYIGLHVVPGIWRELLNFSSGAICLVLASEKYIEEDYIREYQYFKKLKGYHAG